MTTAIVHLRTELDILLIEDNAADAELAVRELHRHKLANKIHVIGDGAEALDYIFCRGAYQNESFSNPPKVNGLEVLKAIKGDPRTRAIPVVIMTSSKEQRDLIESYQADKVLSLEDTTARLVGKSLA